MKRQLVLLSTSFLWTVAEEGLLYNTVSGKSMRFHCTDRLLKDVCAQWCNMDNLYSAKYEDEDASNDFLLFVEKVCREGFGRLAVEKERVISLPPVLKIKHGVDEKSTIWKGEEQPTLVYLKRIVFFLGGAADGSDWWRQIPYPMTTSDRLSPELVFAFLTRCNLETMTHIDVVISDWDFSRVSYFAEGMKALRNKVSFYFAHPNPAFRNDILDSLVADGYAVTQVCPPDTPLKTVSWIPGRKYHLLVRSEEEYAHWESLLEQGENIDYTFKPIAENNLDFFRANVFLSEEEILNQKLSKKDIFRHQALNVNQFGTLYVFPDGTIHPAADAPAIGTLEDSVHQTIIRELEENHAWRQTRRLISPCKDCIYHDLCPSPSVYERILGVPACTVKQPEKA